LDAVGTATDTPSDTRTTLVRLGDYVSFDLPALGQHSREVLRSLGYSDIEINRLADRGAIR
jgi:crotonobetainyl-CoA:carnitine CoA-transferase CaiB-like acyl-CoA transferase